MFIERPIAGTPVEGKGDANDTSYSITIDLDAIGAEGFLKRYPAVKIMFIMDTHCLESGFFVYKGEDPVSYVGCSFFEVGPSYRPAPPHIPYSLIDPQGLLPRWCLQIPLKHG